MNPKSFGQTDLKVTPIGLGLAALGRPGYINLGHAQDLNHDYDVADMERHAHRVLDAAWTAGIRYYDAARSYGKAEAFLSSWLQSRAIPSDNVVVGSKWGYTYTADWQITADKHEVKEHSLPVLSQQTQESMHLLGDHLNIYQIHSATLDSGVLDNSPVLKFLADLREKGLVIGLSLSGPKQADTLRKAMEIQVDGKPLFRSVQATWNLLSREVGPALMEAHEAGMGVIIKEALANGRLTTRNSDTAFHSQRNLLEKLAAEQNTTIDALCIAAVLAQPWVDVVLSGAASDDHLHSNVAALAVKWTEELTDNTSCLVESADNYWENRSRLAWN